MSRPGRWWSEPGMTGPDVISQAANQAGALIDAYLDDDDPAVIVEAHGGPWKIVPGPMGWWAVQALDSGYGGWHEIPDTAGWLGVGDLEPDRIIGNLLDADELASNWREPGDRPVSTRRVPDEEARARLRADSDDVPGRPYVLGDVGPDD